MRNTPTTLSLTFCNALWPNTFFHLLFRLVNYFLGELHGDKSNAEDHYHSPTSFMVVYANHNFYGATEEELVRPCPIGVSLYKTQTKLNTGHLSFAQLSGN